MECLQGELKMGNLLEEQRGGMSIKHYNPVEIREFIGAFFLGLLATSLLIAYLRAQSRYTDLLKQTQVNERELPN